MSAIDLVSRAQSGDATAFESLYRQHSRRIFALCLRMVADPDRAEDLVQETFVRAWEKLSSFRGDSAFATWLHRLAINVVLGEGRRRQSRREGDQVPIDDSSTLQPSIRRSETGIDLERAIAGLPDQARVVFVLHDIEGYRHSEIAELAGIAEGTSKAHLHRARKLLREALTP